MLEKIAKSVAKSSSTPTSTEIPLTIAFLTCVRDEGHRLSYAAFATAARVLGEDTSTQIRAQRGSFLVKTIDVALQPYVCRKSGKYAKGVEWDVKVPENLRKRPVIEWEDVSDAIEEWQTSLDDSSE